MTILEALDQVELSYAKLGSDIAILRSLVGSQPPPPPPPLAVPAITLSLDGLGNVIADGRGSAGANSWTWDLHEPAGAQELDAFVGQGTPVIMIAPPIGSVPGTWRVKLNTGAGEVGIIERTFQMTENGPTLG